MFPRLKSDPTDENSAKCQTFYSETHWAILGKGVMVVGRNSDSTEAAACWWSEPPQRGWEAYTNELLLDDRESKLVGGVSKHQRGYSNRGLEPPQRGWEAYTNELLLDSTT
jgi:hypothetical protein